MKFLDKFPISQIRVRSDGSLVADAKIARTGIQLYAGHEVGRPELDVVRVYRPPDEVFSRDAMASFAHKPITLDHPPEAVNADNWKKYAVGATADEVMRDGECLRVPLMVSDGAAVDAVNGGKKELSGGYDAELVWSQGVSPQGEQYDARQTNIRANHVAIVRHGRAGSQCAIGDEAHDEWGAAPINDATDRSKDAMNTQTLRTVDVDGFSVSTTDQGAQAIEKLKTQLRDTTADNEKAIKAKDEEIADLKKQIDEKDGEIKGLEKKVEDAAISPEKLNDMARERSALLTTAKTVLGDSKAKEIEDKADTDIIKAVVAAKLGDDEIKDMSEDGLRGAFKTIAKDAGKGGGNKPPATKKAGDALRNGLADGVSEQDLWGDAIMAKAGIDTKGAEKQ